MSHKAVRRLKKRYTTQHRASFKFFPSFFLPYTFNNTLKSQLLWSITALCFSFSIWKQLRKEWWVSVGLMDKWTPFLMCFEVGSLPLTRQGKTRHIAWLQRYFRAGLLSAVNWNSGPIKWMSHRIVSLTTISIDCPTTSRRAQRNQKPRFHFSSISCR